MCLGLIWFLTLDLLWTRSQGSYDLTGKLLGTALNVSEVPDEFPP